MTKTRKKTFSSKVQIILLHFEDIGVRNREDVESIRFQLPFTCQGTNKGKFNESNSAIYKSHLNVIKVIVNSEL